MKIGLFIRHLKAVRVPLFIAGAGLVLTFWVDQVRELFFLLAAANGALDVKVGAVTMSILLGVAVWHSARTVYRFRVDTMPALKNPQGNGIRRWLPRLLGTSVPVLMFAGVAEALRDPALKEDPSEISWVMPVVFALIAVGLFALFVLRRRIGRSFGLRWEPDPASDPIAAQWQDLPLTVRRVYGAVALANVGALALAAWRPGLVGVLGPLGIILMTASFLTIAGTWVTIQAACRDKPLFTYVAVLAIACHWIGANDNHRVRLYAAMESKSTPAWAEVDYASPIATAASGTGLAQPLAFTDYVRGLGHPQTAPEPVYLVSAEGGGIRAAAWTALVLTRLEKESGGRFSRHMLAGSGVSGGSLGLALFAALVQARNDGLITTTEMPDIAKQFLLDDFLRGPLETMFLTDLLQRFVPLRLFVDRGQRLENQWERRWTEVLCTSRRVPPGAPVADCHAFERPWRELWLSKGPVPLLFLNATDVGSGTRFVEEPFDRMDPDIPDSSVFAGAEVSQGWLPASAPLSAVVHNSARFTYLSPAGTLLQRPRENSQTGGARQLVDGGYFENSGLTTLVEVGEVLATVYDGCHADGRRIAGPDCPLRFIHISNDPAVEAMLGEGHDSCASSRTVEHYGEVSAPVVALLNTRDGRGRTARAAAVTQYALDAGRASVEADLQHIYHFRLCEGRHHLPLGWTLSSLAWDEMTAQRDGLAQLGADGFNLRESQEIVGALASSQ